MPGELRWRSFPGRGFDSVSQFPQTQHSLIRRLAETGAERDWQQFLTDYWGPLCRFAARWGRLNLDEAEDVASTTLMALISNDLLNRWVETPNAKLRTLLCGVVRNTISNRARVSSGRERIQREDRDQLVAGGTVRADEAMTDDSAVDEVFYEAWVEEVLQECLAALQAEYLKTGRGDYFRVLYGRICESMNNIQIADALDLKTTDVENYFKRAKQHLGKQLESTVAARVRRYCAPEAAEEEVRVEWNRLGEFLKQHGGLENAVGRSYKMAGEIRKREQKSTIMIMERLTSR